MVIPIDQLIQDKKNPHLYTLVLALARRAGEINTGSAVLVKCQSKKPSTIAMEEFREGKVSFEKET